MYFSIDSNAASAGITHALFLTVSGIIVSPSREEFKSKCQKTISGPVPSNTENFNNGMREVIQLTTGKSEFKTAGEKLRKNFSERGFRTINNIIDSYNEAAYFYGLGIGGHDITNANKNGNLNVTLSSGEESIIPLFESKNKKIKCGELIYKLDNKTLAWIGSKDVDSDEFRIGDDTSKCLFVILGHSSVTATELYAVSARIRRNLIESSYDLNTREFETQEFYFNARSAE